MLLVTGTWLGVAADSQRAISPSTSEETGSRDASPIVASDSIPPVGTVAWAEAVESARDGFDRAVSSTDLTARYRRLLALYHGCTRCRRQVYRWLEYKLKAIPRDRNTVILTQEVEAALDPLSLGHLLVHTGRVQEAKRIITEELRRTHFPEHRLHLLEVLAEADGKLGDVTHQRQIARRLLKEIPISETYCDKALVWMSWLGEEPVPNETVIDLKTAPQAFDRLHELEARRGNDAYVSCRFYHELELWDRTVASLKNVNVVVPDNALSLFPNGISAPLQDLARRTSDPKVHASLLLASAFHVFSTPLEEQRLALFREARAVSDLPSIQVGVWRSEFVYISPERRSEWQTLALNMIDRYPRTEGSCEGCVEYWNARNFPWPDLPPMPTPDWRPKCLPVIRHCPDQVHLWMEMTTSSPDAQRSRDLCQALLDMAPPDEVVPAVLFRLSEALREKDPTQAWKVERAAILHPEFPGPDEPGYFHEVDKYGEREHRAESNGDYETALYLDLLAPRYLAMSFESRIRGDRSEEIGREFRRLYLRLRTGRDPEPGWAKLVGLLPATPEDGSSRGLLQPEYLDRLLEAAIVMNEQQAALDWFRAVRQRFLGKPREPLTLRDYGWSEQSLSQAQSMLDGYVARLDNLVH